MKKVAVPIELIPLIDTKKGNHKDKNFTKITANDH